MFKECSNCFQRYLLNKIEIWRQAGKNVKYIKTKLLFKTNLLNFNESTLLLYTKRHNYYSCIITTISFTRFLDELNVF